MVPPIPGALITRFANPASVATWRSYAVAPATVFQVKVGVVETPVAPLMGWLSTTCPGAPASTVRLADAFWD